MIALLEKLIATPSFSGKEEQTADILFHYLEDKGLNPQRFKNNIWAKNAKFDASKPTVLLNSHHDTVQPAASYTHNPFSPTIEEGKLYGLGSNDAGASVVSLIATFEKFYHKELSFNLILAITAEEEAICQNGISALLPQLPTINCAIVGEPTQMQVAIAERGLLVLDCEAKGKSGHAARNEGENALYKALPDIEWFRTFKFPNVSDILGEVKMTVTQIQCGTQHNVVPDTCRFVVDIRSTEQYTNQQLVEIIQQQVQCEVKPRSVHLNASCLPTNHILQKTAQKAGFECYISPTTSDISRMDFPAIKLGPGNSARSHTADEFIYVKEIEEGIQGYEKFLLALDFGEDR